MLTIGKGMTNRLTLTYGLNEVVNYNMWNAYDVPAPNSQFFHFRVVDGANEGPTPGQGEFWGLQMGAGELRRQLPGRARSGKGNLYKLVNSTNNALDQERYNRPTRCATAATTTTSRPIFVRAMDGWSS